MKNRNRWIMLAVILLAIIAVALDYIQHPVVRTSGDTLDSIADEHEESAPCSMDGMHTDEEDDEEEL
jgi:hypothetical protein